MALSATAITTRRRAKGYLRINDADPSFQRAAIDIYYDSTVGAGTSATVEVRENELRLNVTGDAPSVATLDLTAAANDTLDELVSVINGTGSWVSAALYLGDADTVDLVEIAATGAQGIANRQTLNIVNNRFIELLIEQVTAEIETWLGRGIVSRNYSELYNLRRAGGLKALVLNEPDVSAVTRVSLDSSRAMTVEYTGSDESARVEVSDTAVRTITRTGSTTTDTSSTFTGNVQVSNMVTTIAALSGWTASTVTDGPSAFLVREGVRDAKDREITLYAWDDYESDYVVDYDAGVMNFDGWIWPYSLRGLPPEVTRLKIDYTAGFTTVPNDIDLVALEMVVTLFHSIGRDLNVQSESLGDYSFSLRTGGSEGVNTAQWQQRLEKYKRTLP